jgi:sugar transferase (PEP-CTERM/EpsH1 system associated)
VKILFVGAYLPYPLNSGGRIRSYHLLRELAARHEVHLLAFSHEEQPELIPLNDMCRSVKTVPAPVQPDRSAQRVLRLVRSPEDIVIGRNSREMQWALRDHLDKETWDLLILDDMGTEEYVREAGQVPVLLSKHNCEWQLLRRYIRYKAKRPAAWVLAWLETFAMKRCEARVASLADRVIVVSDADRHVLLEIAPKAQVDVVPNGVDTTYFSPASATEDNRLLFTGALFWHPNVDAVCWFCDSIWPLIRRDVPDALLDLVGSEPPDPVRALDRLPGVHVISDIPDVRPHMARSAVYVVPLRVGSGTRLKILEALASGKAVVTTSIGVEGLALTTGEEVVVADDPTAFAAACVDILRDGAKRTSLGRKGRVATEARCDWSIVLAGLNGICVEVGDGAGRR